MKSGSSQLWRSQLQWNQAAHVRVYILWMDTPTALQYLGRIQPFAATVRVLALVRITDEPRTLVAASSPQPPHQFSTLATRDHLDDWTSRNLYYLSKLSC
jgi:hypothetical protein